MLQPSPRLHALSFLAIFLVGFLGAVGELPAKERTKNRERFVVTSKDTEASYTIDVWLPAGYAQASKPLPMLLMLDGDYAFDSAVQIAEILQRSREVEEFIIVGVSYDVPFGEPMAKERTRDFTPPVDEERVIQKTETAYYRFLRDQLLPQLHQRYKIDPAKRTLWGYSLSGSFAAWLNYFDPALFEHTILASGNLMQFGIVQKIFEGQLFTKPFNGRRVFISFDITEVPDPSVVDAGRKHLANKEVFPGYDFTLFMTKGESHGSSWFVSLPAGLRFIFGSGAEKSIALKTPAVKPSEVTSAAHP